MAVMKSAKSEESLLRQLADQRKLTQERDANIDDLLKDTRRLAALLSEETQARSRQGLDHAVALEKIVNLTAERDALLLALVAAYRTRKP